MNATLFVMAALAYSNPKLFDAPAHEGGGAGRYYTGSRGDGYGCDACHGGGAKDFALEVEGLPVGGWAAGATYTLDIAWSPTIEHSSVLAEFTDADGLAVGSLTLPPEDLLTPPELCGSGNRAAKQVELEDGRVLLTIGDCGAHRLRAQWQAPDEASVGPINLHIAAVAGDGSGDASGDSVALENRELRPLGYAEQGCQIADAPERGRWGVLALGLLGLAGLRRRSTLAAVAVVAALSASACVNVQPYERGRLAQPDMELELDADLMAGPHHAVEYREGSAGALGGAGGGCGCN